MLTIKTIDLWTEQYPQGHEKECIKGAFIDGFEGGRIPYNKIDILENCKCIITNNSNLDISNKHNAVIFLFDNQPVRLLVFNYIGNLEQLLKTILNQEVRRKKLSELFKQNNIAINRYNYNLINNQSINEEIDVGSCDNFELLRAMLGGSYSIDDTGLGNNENADFIFNEKIEIEYLLNTSDYLFDIKHKGAFINSSKTRVIPIQKYGTIDNKQIKNLF